MTITSKELILQGRGVTRTIRSRVFQSPLAGVSDQIFRRLVRRWAPEALLFTEMVSTNCLSEQEWSYKIKGLNKEKGPVGVQIFGNCPEAMAEAAIQAEASGAYLIDINMGCPAKKVAKKGGGSGLLKEPKLAKEIVNKVVSIIKIPVTVKTRLSCAEKDPYDLITFAKHIEDSGAQLLTVHGRTRAQGFSGKANWDAIAEIKNALSIPVIANGDIKNTDDACRCLEITSADGVMVGRGIMGSPWLIGQIDYAFKGKKVFKAPGPKERLNLVLEQLQELLEKNGEHGLLIARKHMKWTCQGFKGANDLRHALVRAETSLDAITLLQNQILLMS